MLKQLAIVSFFLPLLFHSGEAYPQPASKTDKGYQPAALTAPITPKQSDSPTLRSDSKPPHEENEPKTIRILLPPKDNYDWLAWFANLLLVGAGIGGIFVAVLTLCRIHNQAVEMRRQRILMERTLLAVRRQGEIMDRQITESKIASDRSYELSTDTAKRQLRAYLGISHAIATITPQGEIGAQVNIENSGATPAYNVRSWSHAIIAPYPSAGILKPPPPGLSQGVSIIPSKSEQYLPAKCFPAASDAEKILELLNCPDVSYFVHGRVEYVDIFKDAHFLTFRLIVGGPATHGFVKDKDGNHVAKLAMDTEGNETD